MHREVSLTQPLHNTLDCLSRYDKVLGALLIDSLAAGDLTGLPGPGDKAAMCALEAQDPDYQALFRRFFAESRRTEKARRYAELSALAAAPLGGLWPAGWTGDNLAHPPLRIAALLGEP